MASDDRYQACYEAIERELDRRGLDYEIHGLPGAEDIIHFEEYWLTNLPERTKLFPAIVDADLALGLDQKIIAAVMAHHAAGDASAYYVILCGNGWSEDRVEKIISQISGRMPSSFSVTIEPLEKFTGKVGT